MSHWRQHYPPCMIIRWLVVAAALLASTMAVPVAHATQARASRGPCFFAGGEEFDQVVVKRKAVRTRSGVRVADLRIVAGHYSSNSSGGSEGYGEFWCVDLVPARGFVRRNPRTRGTITHAGLDQAIGGRGFDDYLDWRGASPSFSSDTLSVELWLEGRRLRAHRVVRATFPELPPID